MKCFKLLIILNVSLLITIQTALGCDIVLKKHTTVSSTYVKVKNIAESYPAKIGNTIITPAPFVNNSITLTKNYISFILKQKGIKASICGAKTVKIYTKTFVLDKALIQKIIGKRVEILTHLPINLPFGKYTFKVASVSSSSKLTFYTIEALKNSKLFRTINITTTKQLSKKLIPVAKRDIEVGEIISPLDITYAKVSNLPPNVFMSKSIIINRIATNFIPKGTPFSVANTRRYKPVKMGDIVNVEVIEGNIKISTIAKALRGGYKGDIIPIMYLTSRKVMPALIIGKKLVVVK